LRERKISRQRIFLRIKKNLEFENSWLVMNCFVNENCLEVENLLDVVNCLEVENRLDMEKLVVGIFASF
jgi:hypothetical protein